MEGAACGRTNSQVAQAYLAVGGKRKELVELLFAQRRGLGKNPIYFWAPILWLCRV
jgi:hypothetical protein